MKDIPEEKPAKPMKLAMLGTGPLSLLKAYFLIKTNPDLNITLFDSSAKIGGAWYTETSTSGYEIECGCHIWSYVPRSYRFIENELGVPLFPMQPSPIIIGKKINLPLSLSNTVETYKYFAGHIVRFNFKKLRKGNKRPYMNYRLFGKKNKYPKTGSRELVQALIKKIEQEPRILIKLNCNVEQISILPEKVNLTAEKTEYEFDKLLITPVSRFNSIRLYGEDLLIESVKVDYIHFLVRSDKSLLKALSYWRLMNDSIVHRITDISYQTENKERLYLIGIKAKAYHSTSEEKIWDYILKLLIYHKLTDKSFKIEKVKTHLFSTHYLSDDVLERLKEFSERIETIHTTDLMHGLHDLLSKEERYLTNTPK